MANQSMSADLHDKPGKKRAKEPKPPDPKNLNRLAKLAAQLERMESADGGLVIWATVDGDTAEWLAGALNKYLSGDAPSLDHAFGLIAPKQRPKKTEEHVALARRILAMKLEGKSWKDIVDTLATDGASVTDPRSLKRIYDEYEIPALADELCRRLAEKDQKK